MSKQETRALIEVALGRRAPRVLIENCRLVNVYSGEILEGQKVATWGERIAYVGNSRSHADRSTEIIDAGGRFLIPGFIDVHGHLDFFQHPLTLAEAALPTGTTAAYTETHDLVAAVGAPGLDLLLKLAVEVPFHLLLGVPAATPQYPQWEGEPVLSRRQLQSYLRNKRVLGLSEIIPWVRILAGDDALLDKLDLAAGLGKLVEGHTAGASGPKLAALVASGLTSCHESITADEVVERLRLGLYTIIRHGSIRADMEELARAFHDHPEMDTSRVLLTPDTVFPVDLLADGYMDKVVSVAIAAGIEPVKAIQMATVNPATYMRLDNRIGGIAPGRFADMSITNDLRTPKPDLVMCRGEVTARDGQLVRPFAPSLEAWKRLHWVEGRWPREAPRLDDLRVPAPDGPVTIPAIHLGHKVLTKRRDVTLPVVDGYLMPDPEQDVLKLAMVDRSGTGFVNAFVSGLRARFGALASTMAHDHHHLMVLGYNDEEMLQAIDHLKSMGGGMVIIDGGRVQAEVHCPIGGVLPAAPVAEVAAQMAGMAKCLKDRGCLLESPLFTIVFISFASLPALRMTPSGVLDVKAGRIIYP